MDIREKFKILDEMYSKGELKQAESEILNWIEQAKKQHNLSCQLAMYNELEGLYRTTKRADKAVEISDKALELIDVMGLSFTVHHATTLLNGATANMVLNNTDTAVKMYTQALNIFTSLGEKDLYKIAALYNNLSHCYQQKGQYEKALENLYKALETVSKTQEPQSEIATTKISIALCLISLNKMDEAEKYLLEALDYYLSDQAKGDGHFSSAMCAAGESYFRKKDKNKALMYYEKALEFNKSHFGDTHSNQIIQNNIEKIKSEGV